MQTTVSRDVHELGLVKVRAPSGRLVYAAPGHRRRRPAPRDRRRDAPLRDRRRARPGRSSSSRRRPATRARSRRRSTRAGTRASPARSPATTRSSSRRATGRARGAGRRAARARLSASCAGAPADRGPRRGGVNGTASRVAPESHASCGPEADASGCAPPQAGIRAAGIRSGGFPLAQQESETAAWGAAVSVMLGRVGAMRSAASERRPDSLVRAIRLLRRRTAAPSRDRRRCGSRSAPRSPARRSRGARSRGATSRSSRSTCPGRRGGAASRAPA